MSEMSKMKGEGVLHTRGCEQVIPAYAWEGRRTRV